MSALVLAQALFKKAWLPSKDLPLAKKSRLKVVEPQKPALSQHHEPAQRLQQLNQLVGNQGAANSPAPQRSQTTPPAQSVPARPATQAQPQQPQPQQTQPVSEQPKPAPEPKKAPSLAVSAPEQFHVAATMMNEHWGVVVSLPQRHAGLQGMDYVMLSKLIAAFQKLCGQAPSQVEFDFFHWPPKRGIAAALNDETFSLNALKGFLHKMAHRKQCSWVILDEKFAQFCFQKPELKAFSVIPRGQHVLLASPSLTQLQSQPELKKELWSKLQELAKQSS